jgi:hypothetical protein
MHRELSISPERAIYRVITIEPERAKGVEITVYMSEPMRLSYPWERERRLALATVQELTRPKERARVLSISISHERNDHIVRATHQT